MRKVKPKEPVARLSFSLPPWMPPLIRDRASAADMTLSQYMRALVRNDLARAKAELENVVNTE
jgi:hypothetical protein